VYDLVVGPLQVPGPVVPLGPRGAVCPGVDTTLGAALGFPYFTVRNGGGVTWPQHTWAYRVVPRTPPGGWTPGVDALPDLDPEAADRVCRAGDWTSPGDLPPGGTRTVTWIMPCAAWEVQVRTGGNVHASVNVTNPADPTPPCVTRPLTMSLDLGLGSSSSSGSGPGSGPAPLLALTMTVEVPPEDNSDLEALSTTRARASSSATRIMTELYSMNSWTATALSLYGLDAEANVLLAGLVTRGGALGGLPSGGNVSARVANLTGNTTAALEATLTALEGIEADIRSRGRLLVPRALVGTTDAALNASRANISATLNATTQAEVAELQAVQAVAANITSGVNATNTTLGNTNATLTSLHADLRKHKAAVDKRLAHWWPIWMPNYLLLAVVWGTAGVATLLAACLLPK